MRVKFNAGHSGEDILSESGGEGGSLGVSSYPKSLVVGCQINFDLLLVF